MTVVTTAQDAPRLKPDSTRGRILDAAEKLFADNTYDGTTLREISALVGIREPSLYAHFANKEAIYEAVIDRALLPFSDALLSWNMSELTLNTLFDMPRKLLELHNAHPYCAQILHREFTSPPQRINPKVLLWQQQFVAQSQQFMEGLPASQAISKAKVVANMISCTNLVLGVFSTRGMQSSLMGEDYDQDLMMAEHLRLATRIFKSLLV